MVTLAEFQASFDEYPKEEEDERELMFINENLSETSLRRVDSL